MPRVRGVSPRAKKPATPKRGPGRPSLTGAAEGTVQLTVRLTRDQADKLDRLDEARGLKGRAGAIRWAIDQLDAP